MSTSTGTCVASQSYRSFGVNWKCHFSFAGVGVERDDGVGVQVVARALRRVEVGPWIADAPVRQVQRRIVRAGDPDRSAAVLPANRRSRSRSRARPGAGIVLKRQASLPVAASYAAMKPRMPYSPPPTPMMTLSFTTSGARRDRVAVRELGDVDVPQQPPVPRVERDEMRIERAHEQRVAEDRQPAVVGAAAHLVVRRPAYL